VSAREDSHPRARVTVVAMGDGSSSGGFPKKSFARELGMRGPTIIADEFATSKVCPCGTCTLEDVPPAGRILPLDASRRPQRHTGSNGPSSPICCALKPFADRGMENDRDELACMNILRCTAAGLNELRPMRPVRFCSDLWRKRRLAPSAN
jgi:hypothetical protein